MFVLMISLTSSKLGHIGVKVGQMKTFEPSFLLVTSSVHETCLKDLSDEFETESHRLKNYVNCGV